MSVIGPVRTSTPADPAMARVVRLLAMRFASSAGLDIDRVEDVAMATGEAFGVVAHDPGAVRVECVVDSDERGVTVVLSSDAPPSSTAVPIDPIAQRVLRSVTDDTRFDASPRTVRFRVDRRS